MFVIQKSVCINTERYKGCKLICIKKRIKIVMHICKDLIKNANYEKKKNACESFSYKIKEYLVKHITDKICKRFKQITFKYDDCFRVYECSVSIWPY